MKILGDEEKNAHWQAVLTEGIKGTVVGIGLSAALVGFVRTKHAAQYARMNASIKAAMWAMPTVSVAALFADMGSVRFDEDMHQSEYKKRLAAEELERWNLFSTSEKIFKQLNDNKYKIVVGAWAASLYGSWTIVNRDPYMTVAQKAVQARVYAQAVSVALLLCTLFLSMQERKMEEKRPPPIPEWKRYLEEQEAARREGLH